MPEYDKRTFTLERRKPMFTKYAVRVTIYEPSGKVARGLIPFAGGGTYTDDLTHIFAGDDGRKVRAQARAWARIAKHW